MNFNKDHSNFTNLQLKIITLIIILFPLKLKILNLKQIYLAKNQISMNKKLVFNKKNLTVFLIVLLLLPVITMILAANKLKYNKITRLITKIIFIFNNNSMILHLKITLIVVNSDPT